MNGCCVVSSLTDLPKQIQEQTIHVKENFQPQLDAIALRLTELQATETANKTRLEQLAIQMQEMMEKKQPSEDSTVEESNEEKEKMDPVVQHEEASPTNTETPATISSPHVVSHIEVAKMLEDLKHELEVTFAETRAHDLEDMHATIVEMVVTNRNRQQN